MMASKQILVSKYLSKKKRHPRAKEKTIEAQFFQALKAIKKTIKEVKGFFVQKCARKITEQKNKNEDASVLVERLHKLKEIDHALIGRLVFESQLSSGSLVECKNDSKFTMDPRLLEQFVKHKRVTELVIDWKAR